MNLSGLLSDPNTSQSVNMFRIAIHIPINENKIITTIQTVDATGCPVVVGGMNCTDIPGES